MMNITEFNNKIEEVGKRIFGDRYSFSSSHVQSIMYGHTDEKVVTYRAVIFYDADNCTFDAESTDVDLVFEILETKYKNLHAKQSDIELN
jgi:hypothetical protein